QISLVSLHDALPIYLIGVFAQDVIDFGDRFQLQLGVRYTFAAADANEVRDPSNNQISINDDWSELTGSVHLRYDLCPDTWNVYRSESTRLNSSHVKI